MAADNSHKWVFIDGSNENDPSCKSSWNASIDPVRKYIIKPKLFFNYIIVENVIVV